MTVEKDLKKLGVDENEITNKIHDLGGKGWLERKHHKLRVRTIEKGQNI